MLDSFRKFWETLDEDQKGYLKHGFIFILLMGFISIFILPLIFTQPWFTIVNYKITGGVGDTINGIASPFIALLAAVLTFLAFYVQFIANENQRKQFQQSFENQKAEFETLKTNVKIERFENKFYESLKVHKDNVQEIQIDGKHQGRKAFVWMYKEYRFIFELTKAIYNDMLSSDELIDDKGAKIKYDESKLAKLAYIIFFFGVGEVSNKGIKYYMGEFDKKLIKKILKFLSRCKRKYSDKGNGRKWVSLKAGKYNDSITELFVNFEPFDGHVSKLGHYFRHLYQLIKLATTDPILNREIEDDEKKIRYEYVKQIRVQLSNHEQAMIYYNSFFDAGKVWWGDETINKKTDFDGRKYDLSYFLDYKMIKNIPYNLTDGIGPDPKQEFFLKFLKRGYSLDSAKERNKLKEKLQNDFFEWGFNDEFFSKYVHEHPNSKVQ